MELVTSPLCARLGSRKVPLFYTIRENSNPYQIELQETVRMMIPSYEYIMDELISCTPHTGDEFTDDNTKVFQILQDMISGTSFEYSIKTEFFIYRNILR